MVRPQSNLPHCMEGYHTAFIQVPELAESTRKAMSELYFAYYEGCDERQFQRDLADKTEALLIHYRHELVGFTLYQLYTIRWQERPVRIIYSGDTIVDHRHWGQQALAFAWIQRAGQLKREDPVTPLYWFLIVKGHRTYRYLPTFSRSFHPHWSEPNATLKALADHLAKQKFAEAYDAGTGVVSFNQSQGHLKARYAQPNAREQQLAAVAFFLQRNPGYRQGDELVCLCELCADNLKPLARRIFQGI